MTKKNRVPPRLLSDAGYYADKSFVTSSMARDWLKSPAYYKAKHVDRTLGDERTPAMLLGSALDCLVTEGPEAFASRFARKMERTCLKRDDPERYEIETSLMDAQASFAGDLLPPAQYDQVLAMEAALSRTSAMRELASYETQVTLVGKIDGTPVKGKLDFLLIDEVNHEAIIPDLKTSQTVDPRRYYWHALDYGYDVQMAMYRQLVLQNYPCVTRVVSRHVAVEKGPWPKVACFQMSDAFVRAGQEKLLRAIDGIARGEFDDDDATWDGAAMIGETLSFGDDMEGGSELAPA